MNADTHTQIAPDYRGMQMAAETRIPEDDRERRLPQMIRGNRRADQRSSASWHPRLSHHLPLARRANPAERGIRLRQMRQVVGSSAFRGQSTLEYAVFSAVVAAALVGMQLYVRRSIQANLKMLEEHINAEALPGALASSSVVAAAPAAPATASSTFASATTPITTVDPNAGTVDPNAGAGSHLVPCSDPNSRPIFAAILGVVVATPVGVGVATPACQATN